MKKWVAAYMVIIFTALGLDWYISQGNISLKDLISHWFGGVIFFGLGWFWYLNDYEFFRRAIIVPGSIDGCYRGQNGEHFVIVSFNFDDKTQTVRLKNISLWERAVGTRCEVGINPNNIQDVRIRSNKWFCIVWAVLGFLVLFGPVLNYLSPRT